MENIITLLIKLVITIIIVIATKFIYPWLKSKLGEQKLNVVKSWATTFVKAAELIYNEQGKGKDKLWYVTEVLNQVLKEMNVSYTEEELRAIIESAVKDLKEGENK